MYDKHQKIATSFSKAAKRYDQAAIVQHKIGLMLIDLFMMLLILFQLILNHLI